jgi:hypothetical protein
MKRQKKRGRRILNKVIKILLIILLLFYLLGLLKGFDDRITLLVKLNQSQQTKIEQLELDNARLNHVVVYQHEQIKELSSEMKVKINGQPIEEKQIHKEEVHKKEKVKVPDAKIFDAPTIIITTWVAIDTLFGKILSPVFR